MRHLMNRIKVLKLSHMLFAVIVAAVLVCVTLLLRQYFYFYGRPYMMNEIVDLSEGWRYKSGQQDDSVSMKKDVFILDNLRYGPKLRGGDTMTLHRTLDEYIPEAAILIRTNHQIVDVYLDGTPLLIDWHTAPNQNPGMALHYILLPEDYLYKTLTVELTSPYDLYSGRTSRILMGTIPSLEAYTLSRSMRSVIIMSMCLLLGFCTIILTFVQAFRGDIRPQHLCIGTFAIIWSLYYVCTEYIVFQFFTPVQMSLISLGLYFSFQIPLALFFYFSFEHYKKPMLPVLVLHCAFPVLALLLQFFSVVDLPRLLNINNTLLAGLFYTIILAVLEACKKNRMMILAAPFLGVAYVSMLYNFSVFYLRRGSVPYSYRDTYFLLILCVLVYSILQFFREYYRKIRESEIQALQHRASMESYEQIKAHLYQVGGLGTR